MAEQIAMKTAAEEDLGNEPGQLLLPELKYSKILLYPPLRRSLGVLTLVATDALTLLAGLSLAGYLMNGGDRVEELLFLAPLLLVLWFAIFAAHGLYGQTQGRRSLRPLLSAILWGIGILASGSIIYPQGGFSPEELLLAGFFLVILGIGAQLLYGQGVGFIYRRGFNRIPTLIVGEKEERTRVRWALEKNPGAYTCVGELSMNGDGGAGGLARLRQMLNRTGARSVILIGAEKLSDAQATELLRSMWLRKVKVKVVPTALAMMNGSPVISRDVGMPLLEVGHPQLSKTQWALKRTLDVMISLGSLVMLSPLLLGVAVFIKLTSPGPVLFRQKRVGADQTTFVCYKFRSMYEDAERRQAEFEALNEADGAVFKIKDDPRITPVGRFLRRWSIDELPQLVNVLKGEMSLVGPRPLPVRDFQRMVERHKRRLATVPGLTGYWQISGRSNLLFEDMVSLDLYYIENWSLSLDLEIILRTFRVVLRREGAY